MKRGDIVNSNEPKESEPRDRTAPLLAALAGILRDELKSIVSNALVEHLGGMDRDQWLDPRSTALGYRGCLRLIATGQLPASRVGKRFLVRRSDVDRYIESQRITPRKPAEHGEPADEAEDIITRELNAGRLRIVRPPPDR
jgi:excisionase family DNA binding protein